MDDVSGAKLDHVRAQKARDDELGDFEHMRVYEYYPRKDWKKLKGAIKVGVRWVDVNKGNR